MIQVSDKSCSKYLNYVFFCHLASSSKSSAPEEGTLINRVYVPFTFQLTQISMADVT